MEMDLIHDTIMMRWNNEWYNGKGFTKVIHR
jgi:hypothetical protein